MEPPSPLALEINSKGKHPTTTTTMSNSGSCTNFVPNKWQPTKCINCFQHHGKTAQPNNNSNNNNNNNNKTIESTRHNSTNKISDHHSDGSTNWSKKHKESKSVDEGRPHNITTQKSQPLSSIHTQQQYLLSPKSPSSPSLLTYFQQHSRTTHKETKPIVTITTATTTTTTHSTTTTTTSSCLGFEANLWRPQICIHCYKNKASHSTPSEQSRTLTLTTTSSNTTLTPNTTTTLPPKHTNPRVRTPPPTSKRDSLERRLSLKSSKENIAPPLNKDVQRLKEELSSELGQELSEEHDPFSDISDLTIDDDEGVETNSGVLSWSSGAPSFEEEEEEIVSYFCPSTSLSMSKYTESEDDWDSGVEVDVLVSQTQDSYTYFSNKMVEIEGVKAEIERTRLDLFTNIHMVEALMGVLNAKEKQIQKAFTQDKITTQENTILMEMISNVLSMLLEFNTNSNTQTHFTTTNETNAPQFASIHFSQTLTNTHNSLQTQQQDTISPHTRTQPSTSPLHSNVFVVC
eukprot:TRINITY_DN3229_c3_g1_i1.p1 TRINITY_DN3229_c3_g1~~TRINITY_DN3229_c3_g1_i1.p1  ORF type:complete len:516 (-),score=138.58 TRINITY_DN3229_c3_g1_i1:145-1692(-)